MKNRTKLVAAIVVTAAVAVPSTAFAAGHVFRPDPHRAHSFVTGDTPLIADVAAAVHDDEVAGQGGVGRDRVPPDALREDECGSETPNCA